MTDRPKAEVSEMCVCGHLYTTHLDFSGHCSPNFYGYQGDITSRWANGTYPGPSCRCNKFTPVQENER